jgi:large subunit ribosomal protein L6
MSEEAVYEQRIEIPSECQVSLENRTVTVNGPKGSLERTFPEPQTQIKTEGNELVVTTHINRKKSRALVGTVIAHVRNMLKGVQHGYEYKYTIRR